MFDEVAENDAKFRKARKAKRDALELLESECEILADLITNGGK